MPFDAEFTNTISVWQPPNLIADTHGEGFTLSVALELPVFLVLPEGVNSHAYDVLLNGERIPITVYQDCVQYFFGDYFTADRILRYSLHRLADASKQLAVREKNDRKFVRPMRSVVRLVREIQISDQTQFVLHQLRPHCEDLVNACSAIFEAERSTYHSMAWVYPHHFSFMSVDLFWVSLYQGDLRVKVFPFAGNVARLGLNPPHPATATDFNKVTSVVTGEQSYPVWWPYYCKAATHFGQRNYRDAALDAMIALEFALSEFVRSKWTSLGVSKSAMENAAKNITLSLMMNVEFMALSEESRKPSAELIGKLNRARKLRNDIVHAGKNIVSESEAAESIGGIREALLLLAPSLRLNSLLDDLKFAH